MKRIPLNPLFVFCLLALFAACTPPPEGNAGEGEGEGEGEAESFLQECEAIELEEGITRPEGWSAASHCKKAPLNAEAVFAEGDAVLELTIHMTQSDYEAMESDLNDLLGGGGEGGGFPPGWVEACEGLNANDACNVNEGEGLCVEDLNSLFCLPEQDFGIPPEWFEACENSDAGDTCSVSEGEGACEDIGGPLVCFPGGPGGPGAPDVEPPCATKAAGADCSHDGAQGVCEQSERFLTCAIRGFGAGDVSQVPVEAAASFWDRKPTYFKADIVHGDKRWTKVGIRYKGNNGLASSQAPKRPLRLEFDQFEDEHPEVSDQRFYGFKELSLASNQTDPTYLHQHAAAMTFRAMNVPAPRTTPARVTLILDDETEIILGLYTLTNIVGKAHLESNFEQNDGNLYKPDGRGAHFLEFVEGSFHKKNNKREADYSDVEAFVLALNERESDAETWRNNLEATFDMPAFIRFLAVNQAIGNWDTYGGIAHNYYLYADEETSKLTYIPWDFDLAFDGTGPSDLSLLSFDGSWPLIQAVVHDPVYYVAYHDALDETRSALFSNQRLLNEVSTWLQVISASAETTPAINGMNEHIRSQTLALEEYLSAMGY